MQCLAALVAQADPSEVEVLVVRDIERSDGVDRPAARRRFPGVRWVDAPCGSTVPRMRALGIAAARGAVVALLEDDCVVRHGWCQVAMGADGGANVAVGGAVEPGPYTRALDWAVYFCEYGRFMLPVPSTRLAPLPGNNVVYQRNAVKQVGLGSDEFHDVFVHSEWQRAGLATTVKETLVVENVNSWSLRHVTSVPYHHGRSYAGKRFGSRRAWTRVAIGTLALSLPALKTFRIIASTVSRKRLVGRLIQGLPWILVFTTSWSLGETMGCLFGPGDSPSRWR